MVALTPNPQLIHDTKLLWFTVDGDGCFVNANATAQYLLHGDLIKTLSEHKLQSYHSLAERYCSRSRQQGKTIIKPITISGGGSVTFLCYFAPDSANPGHVACLGIDISPFYQLITTQKKYVDVIFNTLPITFYQTDLDGFFTDCNQRMADILHLKEPSEAIGKHTLELCNPDAWVNTKRVIEKGEMEIYEETHIDDIYGNMHFLSIKTPSIDHRTNNINGCIGMSMDITEQKNRVSELEEQKKRLREAEQTKSQFLANIRHDIRTPTSNLYALCEVLSHQINSSNQHTENANFMLHSAKQILDMTNEFLEDCSQTDQGDLYSFSLVSLLNNVQALYASAAKAKNLSFKVRYDPNLEDRLYGDRNRLRSIIINLIGHAIQSTSKGYVLLEASTFTDGTDCLIRLLFQDSGAGYTDEQINRLLYEKSNRFQLLSHMEYTNFYNVVVAKECIQKLDGDIYVQTLPGRGTQFIIDLPFQIGTETESTDRSVA